jgi:hypothetical protein
MWLTEKIVRALPVPASGNKIYYDEALPGFGGSRPPAFAALF